MDTRDYSTLHLDSFNIFHLKNKNNKKSRNNLIKGRFKIPKGAIKSRNNLIKGRFKIPKGEIRSRKSGKGRHYNDQKENGQRYTMIYKTLYTKKLKINYCYSI